MAFDKSISPPSGADGFVQWLMTSTEKVLQSAVNEPMQKLFEAIAPVIVLDLAYSSSCTLLRSCKAKAA